MKINEVEKIIGITKKNIRFYEKEGLLSPCRNKENGYREYNEDDIKKLEEIKLLRKLGVPIEDIRSLQNGRCTVSDAMRRHLITLERAKQNIDHSINFCNSLKSEDKMLSDLDVHELLSHMESMESTGASFNNIHSRDVKPGRYIGSVISAALIITFASVLIGFFAFILINCRYKIVTFLLSMYIIVVIAVIAGVLFSLRQRLKEINRGEEKESQKY